tara:strand:- start:9 stop:110 length:102 start_codon:yes stop_codon:yes gene_type:complete
MTNGEKELVPEAVTAPVRVVVILPVRVPDKVCP